MRIAREDRLAAWIVGLLTVVVVLGWLGVRYLTGRSRATEVVAWYDPRKTINWRDVDPLLALRELGGTSSLSVFEAALEVEDIETAYATLVYASDLEPSRRSGLWLALSERAGQQGERSIQRTCLRVAAWTATLAPDMPDLARTDTFLAAGRGLQELGASADALYYLDQAYTVARYSEHMTQPHRRMVLDALIPLYVGLGRRADTWQVLYEQVRTPVPPTGESASPVLAVQRPQLLYLSDIVVQAAGARQRMALEVLSEVPEGQETLSQYQVDNLASVLQSEDRVRSQRYNAGEYVDRRSDWARDRVAWMILKSRIAHRDFGVSIVPEWEVQVSQIDAELRAAYDALYAPHERSERTEERQRARLMRLEQGLLGLYPGWLDSEWFDQEAQLELQHMLFLSVRMEGQSAYFFLCGRPDQ